MPSQKNIDAVKVIDDKLKQCKNIILVDYAGLNVADQTELRKQIKAAGGEFTVHKNSLLKLTLANRAKNLPDNVFDALEGPTAIVYGYEDAAGAAKVTVGFAKEHEDTFKIKVGVMAGTEDAPHQALTIDDIKQLALLPGIDQLRAQVVGTLNAPISGFVRVLSGNLSGLAQVLKARQDQLATAN